MVERVSRRAVLLASATTATGALGGCLWNNPEISGGHLYIENRSFAAHRLRFVVTEGEDIEGEEIVANWYRVPQGYALQFKDVIQPETAYTITVHGPSVPPADRMMFTIPPCDEDEGGTRDVSIRVQQTGTSITPQGCDENYTLHELEYVDPSEYIIDPPENAETATDSE